MNWKVGDKFIICGDDKTLFKWNLLDLKGKVMVIDGISLTHITFESPRKNSPYKWSCPISCARKLTKLDKALK